MPQISIIVPVYNVEPYLRECVDSILAQSFADFELILVDDGSPDNCGDICDEYAGPFEKEPIETALEEYIRGREWPMGKVMNCLRLALSGSGSGLGIADIICRLGRKEVRMRFDNFLKTI